jgi:hypothetical protein
MNPALKTIGRLARLCRADGPYRLFPEAFLVARLPHYADSRRQARTRGFCAIRLSAIVGAVDPTPITAYGPSQNRV